MRQLISIFVVVLGVASSAGAQTGRVVDAARAGNRDALRALVRQRVDVNVPESDGTTALHWAVRAGDVETVDVLLRAGANARMANRYSITPLSLAAVNGDAPMIERLLAAGADVSAPTVQGQTPMLMAARTGRVEAIRVLAAKGADVNVAETWMGETPLMWAAAENNAAAIRALVELGAKVNARSATLKYPAQKPIDPSNYVSSAVPVGQWTPLMYAARQGAVDAARALIDAGADVNAQDPESYTPLLQAIVNGHFDLAGFLLEKGANPNLADKSGMTPLYAAVDMRTQAWERSRPDVREADVLDCLALMTVLLDHGANINAQLKARTLQRYHANGPAFFIEGTTPLMRASKYDNLDLVQLLLTRGADVNLKQADGTTALMLASGVKYAITQEGDPENAGTADDAYEIVRLMLERGADANAANTKGETALYGAAFTGRNRVISHLAEKGARLDVKTGQGLTILDAALNVGVTDDGTGSRVGGKPGDSTVSLVRTLMASAGVQAAPSTATDVEVPGTRPARQGDRNNPLPTPR